MLLKMLSCLQQLISAALCYTDQPILARTKKLSKLNFAVSLYHLGTNSKPAKTEAPDQKLCYLIQYNTDSP